MLSMWTGFASEELFTLHPQLQAAKQISASVTDSLLPFGTVPQVLWQVRWLKLTPFTLQVGKKQALAQQLCGGGAASRSSSSVSDDYRTSQRKMQ